MENINIETTHNVFIDYKQAGLGDRLLAYLIDIALRVLFLWGSFALAAAANIEENDSLAAIYFIIIALLFLCYDLYMEMIFHGQSVGKKLIKIKVMKLDGTEPTFSSYLLRWLLALIDVTMSSGAIAIISIAASKYGQRLGDIAGNTTVVKIKSDLELKHTIFESVQDNYTVEFPEVKKLNDQDISLVKDLLNAYTKPDPPEKLYEAMMLAKEKLLRKMGTHSDMEPFRFLRTLVKDYNKEFGKL